jgi:hypothetical protein
LKEAEKYNTMENQVQTTPNIVEFKGLKRSYKNVPINLIMDKLIKHGVPFYVRIGTECNELIYEGTHKVFATKNRNFPRKFLFLFNSVALNVKKYLSNVTDFQVSPKKKVALYSYTYDNEKGVLTGTDLDHAFWRIAYVKNYISQRTYEYGLDDSAKALRLATISVLGREKSFQEFNNGVFVKNVVYKERDERMQLVYEDVRHSCYLMMYELCVLLGDDFESYKTDCVYYRDTPENRKIVHDYLDERNMLYKQLVFNTMDKFVINEEAENVSDLEEKL